MWKLPFFIANIKMHVKVKESVHRFEDIWGVQLMWQSSMQSWWKEACDSYNQSICFYLLFAPHSEDYFTICIILKNSLNDMEEVQYEVVKSEMWKLSSKRKTSGWS